MNENEIKIAKRITKWFHERGIDATLPVCSSSSGFAPYKLKLKRGYFTKDYYVLLVPINWEGLNLNIRCTEILDDFNISDSAIAHKPLAPTNVIFNGPATIVFWNDGTKTIVKCSDGDEYDPEKGLAMAYSKKLFGNKGNYCKQFKKWLPKEEKTAEVKTEVKISLPVPNVSSAVKAMRKLNEALKKGGRGMQ